MPYTAADRAEACRLESRIHAQKWRADHTETSHLTSWEAGMWGILAEKALARYLGIDHEYELTGSHPSPDLVSPAGLVRYEVRGTPWKSRAAWESGQWRTFVYPREVTGPPLVIARADTFLAGGRIWLTGWMWAADAGRYPLDPGVHLRRHAVPGPDPLRRPETMPRECAGRCGLLLDPALAAAGYRLHPCCDRSGAELWCLGCGRAHPGGCSCVRPRLWQPREFASAARR